MLTPQVIILISFVAVIVLLLALDIGFLRAKSKNVSNKEAAIWSGVWIGLALSFGVYVLYMLGHEKAEQYLTAYLIEEALSIDNLFVFILVFNFFKVPTHYQHKVLFYGIVGAVIFRAIFIFSGVWLIDLTYLPPITLLGHTLQINVILTLFGGFLVYAGLESLKAEDESVEKDFSKNLGVRLVKAIFPVTDKYDKGNFFTLENGKRMATLLLVVVAVIEITDVLFAVDSIPAIFSISKDPFILYTSNIFAILGLRSLYFLLANTYKMFGYLKYGLAIILTFIGIKMVLSPLVHISSALSLGIVAGVLFVSVVASLVFKPQKSK